MGNDAALPVLSNRPKVLYSYFKQLFAQVTNPPIDPIREELVMSLVTFIGPRPNLLGIDVTDAARCGSRRSSRSSPTTRWRRSATSRSSPAARSRRTSSTSAIPRRGARTAWRPRSRRCAREAEDAIQLGYNILILSDRKVSAELMPIPALLATAAVHQHLVRKGLRTSTGLVVETGSAREVHHFALLAGYGAEAIHPYLALETLASLREDGAGRRRRRTRRSATSRRSARDSTR